MKTIEELAKLLKEENKKAKTVGECKNLVVIIPNSVEELGVEGIQAIEKSLDDALKYLGLTRSTTHKGDIVILNYYRFAVCLDE